MNVLPDKMENRWLDAYYRLRDLGLGGIDYFEFTFYAQRTIKEVLKEIKYPFQIKW